MIVVDTNVIAHFWIPGEQSILADRLMRKDSNWVTSVLWRSEMRNVLANFMRVDKLSLDEAKAIITRAEEQMRYSEIAVSSYDVLEILHGKKCSAYDAEFIAVALQNKIPLITFDKPLVKTFPNVAIDIHKYIQEAI